MFSVNAHCVKKSLLREPNLTLTKFVKICHAAESSRDQLKVMWDSDSFAVSAVKRSGPPGGHSGPSGGHGSVSGGRGGACTSRGGGRGGHNSKKSQSQAYARSNILVILMLNRPVCSQKSSNSLLPYHTSTCIHDLVRVRWLHSWWDNQLQLLTKLFTNLYSYTLTHLFLEPHTIRWTGLSNV